MPLTLTIINHKSLSPLEATRVVDHGHLTIGRSADSDWVLSDPEQLLSRKHCRIEYRDNDYYITDTSANGVFINAVGQPLGEGQTTRLNDGDIITLSKYEIRVSITAVAGQQGSGLTELFAPLEPLQAQPTPISHDILHEAVGPVATANLLIPALQPLPSSSQPLIPEGMDLLQDRGLVALSIPPLASELEHLPPIRESFEPPKSVKDTARDPNLIIPLDWEVTVGDQFTPGVPRGASTAVPPSAPPVRATSVPPLPPEACHESPVTIQPPPVTPVQAPVTPTVSPAPDAGARAVLKAFLEGAGLPQLTISDAELLEFMRTLGKTFRQTVQGLREMLMARSRIKRDIGTRDMTMLGPVANNPLKFSVTVEEAMLALLTKRGPAYMPPLQALEEGFNDIKTHELAMLAGMQAALAHILRRFDPHTLETRLGQAGVLDKILAGGRKAKYWDLFTNLYAEIVREAEEDFQELFGREFARAYEEQLRKL
jgi:type VI secretion system protein